MSRHRRNVWLIHGAVTLCAASLLGAMAALTRGTLSAERERALAESRAVTQENMRLALWRMDAAATAWIADEAQRPVISQMKKDAPKPEVRLRFEAREDGTLISDGKDQLASLGQLLGLDPSSASLFPAVCAQMPEMPTAWSSAPPVEDSKQVQQRPDTAYQQLANTKELGNRGRAVKSALDVSKQQFEENIVVQNAMLPGEWSLVRSGLPRPAWIEQELFLLRHLQWKRPEGAMVRSIQGSWIDAAKLQATLLAEIADLFPQARLVPVAGSDDEEGMTLASFPWKFDAGLSTAAAPPEISRVVLMPLVAGWAAAVLAIAAAWLLVAGLLRLSEKRASFVSAVTHELRTPLTTFQLYSDMLESGAVKEERRGDYFRTLRREAERLSHLVENVLAFSRIERGCARSVPTVIAAGDLVKPMIQRFGDRLQEVGLVLKTDPTGAPWQAMVRADVAAVEHVLFNLIDNAAKYAAGSTPPEVSIDAEPGKRSLSIVVRDHGPGVLPGERKRVFRAFHKSAAAAAESRPGVGLGLALSRRLARGSGGDLVLRATDNGTCFVLSLPLHQG